MKNVLKIISNVIYKREATEDDKWWFYIYTNWPSFERETFIDYFFWSDDYFCYVSMGQQQK